MVRWSKGIAMSGTSNTETTEVLDYQLNTGIPNSRTTVRLTFPARLGQHGNTRLVLVDGAGQQGDPGRDGILHSVTLAVSVMGRASLSRLRNARYDIEPV